MSKFVCDGKIIRDEYGRHRLFRGLNVCIKTDSISSHTFIKKFCSDKFFDVLKKNGFNIVRLGISWDYIEPDEGEYSLDYIEAFKKFISMCEANGIYVMLDMHQDLFSKFLTGHGDGAPLWAVKDYTLHQKPYAIWAEGYFYMDNVQKAFCDFWHNEKAIQDKYIKMWSFFAEQFKDCDNVIAFDYMNEPFVDKNGRNIFLTILKKVVKKTRNVDISPEIYFQKYDNKKAFRKAFLKVALAVRSIGNLKKIAKQMDNSSNFGEIIKGLEVYTNDFNKDFYEPFINKISEEINPNLDRFNVIEHNYYSNLGIPFSINPPKNCLYSPHAYDLFIDSPLYNNYSSNERVDYITSVIKQNQDKMNLPVLFGEWGGGASGHNWIPHIDHIMNIMEENLWSNIYWGYEDNKVSKCVNRPYPVAFNGTVKKIKTDTKEKSFYLEWEQSESIAPNLLYVPDKGIIEVEGVKGENTLKITY